MKNFGSKNINHSEFYMHPTAITQRDLLNIFIERAPAAFAMFDTNMIYLMVSKRWLKDYSLEGQQIIGKSHYEIFPEIPAHWREFHRRALAGETFHNEEDCFQRTDGSLNWHRWDLVPWLDVDGRIGGIVIFTEDITSRKLEDGFHHVTESQFKAIMEGAADAIHIKDLDGQYLHINTAASKIVGKLPAEIIGRDDRFLFPPETAEAIRAVEGQVAKDGITQTLEETVTTATGSLATYLSSRGPVRDEQNNIIGTFAITRDITERKRLERELERKSWELAEAQRISKIGSWSYEIKSNTVRWSDELYRIFDLDKDTFDQKYASFLNRVHPDDRDLVLETNARARSDGGTFQIEYRILARNGSIKHLRELGYAEVNDQGEISDLLGTAQDITDQKKNEEIIWQQANFDPLTHLPNRSMFHERLKREILQSDRSGHKFALIYLDLDRFKEINDTLGHDIGDRLLKDAAGRISSCVRESDTVARLGGDEFSVILGCIPDPNNTERVAEQILERLAEPFCIGDEIIYISGSIGITIYPDDGTSEETLLKNADQAMFAVKHKGKNSFQYFTPFMQEAANIRLRISRDLHTALAENQFLVYFQPIIDLSTGCIHKAEALIRWQHPAIGMVSPATFIPIAEETGMISSIGDWVFKESVKYAKKCRQLNPGFQISVNKSPVQFRDRPGCIDWFKYLGEVDFDGQGLVVEITEGLLADSNINEKLLAFRDAGIQVSLDDFGTGYSSLSYLKKFDIDYLKIDQSFTKNLNPDSEGSEDMALSEAIIVMAHKLGIKVIAEGIETQYQRDVLTEVGCDFGQGYLFAKPIPAEEFEKLLNKNG